MAFIFSLKALLRLREIHENSELQALQAVTSQVAAARTEIEALDAAVTSRGQEICVQSLTGVSGAELQFHTKRQSFGQERREVLLKKLEQLEKNRQAQQVRYLDAHKQREILSTLREHQFSAYEVEESRRSQRLLDELFLMRCAHERQDSGSA